MREDSVGDVLGATAIWRANHAATSLRVAGRALIRRSTAGSTGVFGAETGSVVSTASAISGCRLLLLRILLGKKGS